ncbi:G-protein-coupled receptor kinase 7A [Acipenser ruthenus]|uniref:G protein-coupled receptor kinase n=1 Tax=Acipenser ruthenus TaxID=7906 RepID=A0A444UMN4_ACIRT|nr:rhodopsin kinase grk7a [Acipenser ruthenus]RXM36423.1 G-protein-coupled receptor kinase 7A [Acipenser ruthenus]
MCDMGGLDNLIANTAYLQARKSMDGDTKEMLKRRRSLSLPSPDQCAEMRQKICIEFESVCEQQPIGKRFFRQFTQTVPEYQTAVAFLDELNNWELAENTGRDNLRQNIATSFLKPDSKNFISYVSPELAEKCKNVTEKDFEEVMVLAKEETRKFLMGKPFQEFQSSLFFDKFMQWKVFERQPITEKYFYEFRILGKGGFGEVCAIQVKVSGQMYACKKMDKKRLKKKKGEKMALLEKKILEKVNSPFIVKLAYAYESKTHLCLVMSLMNGGDLKYHIYNIGERGIEMNRAIYYTAQITCGILHLHSINIVYRDMKPENVLLDDNGQCRLSDLGLAIEIKEGKQINQKAGTSGYMAPEILNEENYTHSVDWFALGCSIYEMIAGRTPFKDFKEKVNKDEVKRRCLEDEVKFEHANFDEPTKDICKQFLVKKVEERLGCRGANDDPRMHPWFKSIQFHRLEAGLVDPPFVPDPSVVYAKEIGDIADFSEIRGIEFDDKDKKFFKRFGTGAVSIPWQEEMIESGLFDELNNPNRKESKAMDADTGESKSGVCLLL